MTLIRDSISFYLLSFQFFEFFPGIFGLIRVRNTVLRVCKTFLTVPAKNLTSILAFKFLNGWLSKFPNGQSDSVGPSIYQKL